MKKILKPRPNQGNRGRSAPASGVCPVRLSAMGDEEVLRSTWVVCLRDLRAHLEKAARGVDVQSNLDEAGTRLSILYVVLMTMGYEAPCCLEGNLNKARIARCLNALRREGGAFQEAYDPTEPNYHPSERRSLIMRVLQSVPEAEEFQGIVGDLRVPFCACPDCEQAYSRGQMTFECRYCHSILGGGALAVPISARPLLGLTLREKRRPGETSPGRRFSCPGLSKRRTTSQHWLPLAMVYLRPQRDDVHPQKVECRRQRISAMTRRAARERHFGNVRD